MSPLVSWDHLFLLALDQARLALQFHHHQACSPMYTETASHLSEKESMAGPMPKNKKGLRQALC